MSKKKTIIAFLAGFVLLLSLGLFFYLYMKKPLRIGKLHLKDIKESVSVHFDNYGVPHIYARHEADGYKALGYLHAQDRLFQMEMLRRVAKGQLSEIFGKDFIPIDKFFRTLRIRHYVKKYVDKVSPYSEVFLLSQAYIDGVNQFIKDGPNPIEFDLLGINKTLFSLEDSICISAYMAYTFAPAFKVDPLLTYIQENLGLLWLKDISYNNHRLQSAHMQRNNPRDLQTLMDVVNSIHSLTGTEFFAGSNAWAVSGKKTKSGFPLLANDPHIHYGIPSVWYEAHLVTDRIDLYGHYIAGLPMAILGHTPDLAWGVTMFQNDDVDLFRERVNPKSSEQIWVKDKWETLQSEEETIKVKGEEPINFPVRFSKRGPIISDVILSDDASAEKRKSTELISLWWAFFEPSNDVLSAFYGLPRSQSFSEVPEHIEKIQSPGLNIMYADKKGNIAWYAAAKIPKREKDVNPSFILNGETTKPYTDFRPFSENPSSINPPEGFIVSANSEPQSEEAIPGYYAKKFRFEKITQLLQQKSDWTIEDFKKIQLDDDSNFQNQILSHIIEDLKSFNVQNESQNKALEALLAWKGEHKLSSTGPVIFYQMISLLIQEIFSKKLPPKFFDAFVSSQLVDETLIKVVQNERSIWWGIEESDKTRAMAHKRKTIQAVWKKTIETLSALFGNDVSLWTWEKVNILEHKHPLGKVSPLNFVFNIGPFSMEGGREVINNQFSNLQPGIRSIHHGPSTRRIIDLQDSSRSFGINPTGQSGYFLDKHYNDQVELYHSGQYRLQLTRKEEIEKASQGALTFYP